MGGGIMYKQDTPIWQLTVGEFQEILKEAKTSSVTTQNMEIVKGLAAFARLYGVEKQTHGYIISQDFSMPQE
jgi:hypothetical protein